MDTPSIGGLPPTPATTRIGRNRDPRNQKDRPFEQAFNSSGESDNTQTTPEEERGRGDLQRSLPTIRKTPLDGEHVVDVIV